MLSEAVRNGRFSLSKCGSESGQTVNSHKRQTKSLLGRKTNTNKEVEEGRGGRKEGKGEEQEEEGKKEEEEGKKEGGEGRKGRRKRKWKEMKKEAEVEGKEEGI